MRDLCAGIEVLPRACKGDAGELHAGVITLEDAHRVQAADMRAEGTGHPLDNAVFLDKRALGVEVIHVLRPVLDGRIAQLRVLLDIQLDAAGVEISNIVLRSGAALDEVQARALVDDDERVLELSRALGVEAEVGLERYRDLHTLRHIHERAARPHRAVERGELMVARGDELHEILMHHLGIFALERALHICVYDTLLGDLGFNIVIDKLGVVLRADTCK